MQINWFTFFAQIVNFLIVLFVLRRFLYRPILSVMAEREAQIAARFEEAEELAAEARAEAESSRKEREELQARREALMQQAAQIAEQRRNALIDDARAEVEDLQKSWYAAVEYEKEHFLQELRVRMGETVYNIARDALTDLAGADLEEAIAEAFLQKVSERSFETSAVDGEGPESEGVVIVRSAFELPPGLKERIRDALTNSEVVEDADDGDSAKMPVAFTRGPDLICGIEAQFSNRRIAWSIRDYLDSYAEKLEAALLSEMSARAARVDTSAPEASAGEILPG